MPDDRADEVMFAVRVDEVPDPRIEQPTDAIAQARLAQGQLEPAARRGDLDATARKSMADRLLQRLRVAGLADRLQRGGQVSAIVTQHGGAGADLGGARRGLRVGPQLVIEPPEPDPLAQDQQFRGPLRARD